MIALNIAAAFLIAVLTGIGVGGGGLLVLYMTFAMNSGQISAQGLNLLFFLTSSVMSMPVHISKRKIDFKTVCLISAAGIIGAVGGVFLSRAVKPELIRKIFGGLLALSGALVLFRKTKK